jgi:hypothetical protein
MEMIYNQVIDLFYQRLVVKYCLEDGAFGIKTNSKFIKFPIKVAA